MSPAGETVWLSEVPVLLVQGAVQLVAFVELQESVELCPAVIFTGEAVIETVGGGVDVVFGGGTVIFTEAVLF